MRRTSRALASPAAYRVDIAADLNDGDETGYIWTFLDEAHEPGQIKPGALVVAGDEDTAAVLPGRRPRARRRSHDRAPEAPSRAGR